jgi:hypothetical protein
VLEEPLVLTRKRTSLWAFGNPATGPERETGREREGERERGDYHQCNGVACTTCGGGVRKPLFLNFDNDAVKSACLHNFFLNRELIFLLLSYKCDCNMM